MLLGATLAAGYDRRAGSGRTLSRFQEQAGHKVAGNPKRVIRGRIIAPWPHALNGEEDEPARLHLIDALRRVAPP